jgi:cytochrome b561
MSGPVQTRSGHWPGRVSLGLHWGVGFGVLGLIAFGFWLRTVSGGPDKTALVQIHKSFGVIVFVLAIARVAWRMREGFPAPAGLHAAWERRSAIALHAFLIVATLLMPISGILRSLAYARPVSVFGLPVIPKLFEAKHETLYALAANLHDGLALALSAALALHVGAALKHHWVDRDGTLLRILGLHREGKP